VLDAERKFYDARLPELLEHHDGKFVLIKGEALAGVFDTMNEALREGARRFGLEAFLARRVQKTSADVSFPAYTLGLLHARPPHSVRSSGR
jgi:hypothetical protein